MSDQSALDAPDYPALVARVHSLEISEERVYVFHYDDNVLPDESAGIDTIARTLVSAFDQADILALRHTPAA